jgi:hypothetical protein
MPAEQRPARKIQVWGYPLAQPPRSIGIVTTPRKPSLRALAGFEGFAFGKGEGGETAVKFKDASAFGFAVALILGVHFHSPLHIAV